MGDVNNAKRDENYVTSVLFVGSDGLTYPVKGDETTGRLYVDSAGGGSGDVNGPASANDNAIVRFNGATGKVIQDYTSNAPTISDSGVFNIPGLTASQLLAMDGSNNLVSLSTGTYPSLTELTYLKGVTSAIQTQLDSKGTGNGDALTSNPLSQFAATTSAQLAGVISDETGSGNLVFATSPTLVTPNLGTPSAVVLTNATGTAASLTAGNVTGFTKNSGSLTLSGGHALTLVTTGVTSVTLPTSGTLMANLVEDTTPQLGGELDAQDNSIGFTMQTATGDGTTTIDWRNGNHFDFTFGAFNETFTFTAPSKPCVLTLSLKQDSTGSRTATWPGTVKWPGGTAPTLTTTATTGYDIISFRYDGTNYYGVSTLDFS